jgi:hypothetical protein
MFMAWMSITLFTHVTFGKVFLSFTAMTVVTVVVSGVMFVLPLIFTPFRYGGRSCVFEPGEIQPPPDVKWTAHLVRDWGDWTNAMYFVPLVIMSFVPLTLVAYTRIFVYPKMKLLNNTAAVRGMLAMRCIQNVQYYPLLMALFWLPNYIAFLTDPYVSDNEAEVKQAVNRTLETLVLSTMYPLGVAVYFFYRSSEARMRWRRLLGIKSAADDSIFSKDEYESETDRDTGTGSTSSASAVGGDVFNPTLTAGGEVAAHTNDNPANKRKVRRSHGDYAIDFDDDAEIDRLSEAIFQCRDSSVGLPETSMELPDRRGNV